MDRIKCFELTEKQARNKQREKKISMQKNVLVPQL